MRPPGPCQHWQHSILEWPVQHVTGQTRVTGFVRGALIPGIRGADEERENLAVVTIDHVLGFGRGDADRLRFRPGAALPPLPEEHAHDRAASRERLAHVDCVHNLAIREPRQGHCTFGRGDVLPQLVQEPLPLRRFHRGGANARGGVADVRLLDHVGRARPILRLEHRIVTKRAIAAKKLPILGLEQGRPDVFTDFSAIGVVRGTRRHR